MSAHIIPPTPDSARVRALTDISNLGGKASRKSPAKTPRYNCVSVDLGKTPELYYDATETPRVTLAAKRGPPRLLHLRRPLSPEGGSGVLPWHTVLLRLLLLGTVG